MTTSALEIIFTVLLGVFVGAPIVIGGYHARDWSTAEKLKTGGAVTGPWRKK